MNVRDALKSLPLIGAGKVPVGDEAVEGDEGRVHYTLTKETWPIPGDIAAVFHLSLSGRSRKRQALYCLEYQQREVAYEESRHQDYPPDGSLSLLIT